MCDNIFYSKVSGIHRGREDIVNVRKYLNGKQSMRRDMGICREHRNKLQGIGQQIQKRQREKVKWIGKLTHIFSLIQNYLYNVNIKNSV